MLLQLIVNRSAIHRSTNWSPAKYCTEKRYVSAICFWQEKEPKGYVAELEYQVRFIHETAHRNLIIYSAKMKIQYDFAAMMVYGYTTQKRLGELAQNSNRLGTILTMW